jgi:Flp pilus assembly protein TadG
MARIDPLTAGRRRRNTLRSGLRSNSQRGSALLELALCFLSFLLLVFGALDFGMAVYAYNFCTYAARDATRWATVHGAESATSSNCSANPGIAGGCAANSSDVSNYVSNMAVGLSTSNLTVTTTWTPNTNPGAEVNVNVAYLVIPLTGMAMPNNLNVSSASQMEMVH